MEELLSVDAAEDSTGSLAPPARLRVASRTAAPVSNVCSFQADLLQGVNHIAFATSDGCIVIQQVSAWAGAPRL